MRSMLCNMLSNGFLADFVAYVVVMLTYMSYLFIYYISYFCLLSKMPRFESVVFVFMMDVLTICFVTMKRRKIG